ncbi:MAG: F0F1 ATP synthase subunit B', partial [Alphaproteobacteria bacterium]|nr:F0F1 ATP synthase subunit B' [Alphaproteobacteria bacterium]
MAAVFYAAEAAAAPGLPQLDPSYFPSQVFWLAVFFVLLYFLLSQALLPKLAGVIETRANTIRSNVDAAAAANAEAQAALAAYEKALATARADARKLAEGVRADAAA